MKKFSILIIIFFSLWALGFSQIPERPNPPRLVNDFADILSPDEELALERKLVSYNDSTSTQITIVSVVDLAGMDKAQFAVEVAHKWGVGQKDHDNGMLILVKPKSRDSKGEAYIAVGYGLEGFIPDATAKRIVENEMIPQFKNGNMYQGIDNATNSVISLLSGEFTADQYNKQSGLGDLVGVIFFIIIIIIFIFAGRAKNSQHGLSSRQSSFPWWILLLGSGGGGSGGGNHWGTFSGGGGSFGGFGGGGFGGGGAGGSW